MDEANAPRPRRDVDAGVRRILVATDRSETAEHAVRFAADMALRFEAELFLCQVVVPPVQASPQAKEELLEYGREFVGELARAVIGVGEDPAQAIVDTAEAEDVDVVVVGNVGMSGRKEFLLGNVPNRVSHNSHRTVVIVNTRQRIAEAQKKKRGWFGR